MKNAYAKVTSHERLADEIYRLSLETEVSEVTRAGQFVNVYLDDMVHLLPRPISVCDIEDDGLTLVYRVVGEGTRLLSQKKKGDTLRILAPLGNGYDTDMLSDCYENITIIGGGLGIPPMLALSKAFIQRKKKVSVLLGYRDDIFLKEEFESTGADIFYTSDSGSVGKKGTVLDGLVCYQIKPDVICSCGPLPMLRALDTYANDNQIKLYVSLEERMACGVGACLGCVVNTKSTDAHSMVHNARVCKDGPVFDASEVML